MAERTEFELPSVGWVRNHVTNATADFHLPRRKRKKCVCFAFSFEALHERQLKVINFAFQSLVCALEDPL